jgi:hypothetical protein
MKLAEGVRIPRILKALNSGLKLREGASHFRAFKRTGVNYQCAKVLNRRPVSQ